MKNLFYRNPLLALAIVAVLLMCNYYKDNKKSLTQKVSLNKEEMKLCISKKGERKPHCFDLPGFFATGDVSLTLQKEDIFVHYFDGFVAAIDTKWEFDEDSNKLFLKKFIGQFPDRQNHYDGEKVCSIDDTNIFIGDIDEDSFIDSMTYCHYEYTDLPPLQKILDDMVEMAKIGELRVYSSGEYINRYEGYLRTYPVSNANHVIYNNMGYYLEQAEAYDAAIYLLNAVLEKYPQRVVAHLNIADAYWGNGERVKARKHYEEYVRLMKDQKKDISNIPQTVYDRLKPTPPFTDSRDGRQYRVVEIGDQTWMAENLNYELSDGSSWCYERSVDNCTKYGRLYDGNTAKNACPIGWHISTDQEWEDLAATVGGKRSVTMDDDHQVILWDGAGAKLKSRNNWTGGGNGTDDYGFSALPGGTYGVDYVFSEIGNYGCWWTDGNIWCINHTSDRIIGDHENDKTHRYSVRCVQN
jgi:uncharacterized protein (TIGR02145 family)